MRKAITDKKGKVLKLVPYIEPKSEAEQAFYQKQKDFVMKKYKFSKQY